MSRLAMFLVKVSSVLLVGYGLGVFFPPQNAPISVVPTPITGQVDEWTVTESASGALVMRAILAVRSPIHSMQLIVCRDVPVLIIKSGVDDQTPRFCCRLVGLEVVRSPENAPPCATADDTKLAGHP